MLKEFGKPLSGPVNPALDRAKRGSADFGDLLIAVTLRPHQQHRLALLIGQARQSRTKRLELRAPWLLWKRGELGGIQAIHILHLALSSAVVGVEQVAQDREEPSLHLGVGLKLVLLLQGAQDRILNQIVRPVSVANKGQGKGAKARRHREKVCTEVSLSLFRRSHIPNRRGREWTSDLESGWGVERARGRGRREIRLDHEHCPWSDRWRIRRSLGAEVLPCTPACDQRKPSISFGPSTRLAPKCSRSGV